MRVLNCGIVRYANGWSVRKEKAEKNLGREEIWCDTEEIGVIDGPGACLTSTRT